jgi:hypothetical protein
MVMENNRSESEAEKESLKQERNVAYKDVINANLAHNTPFYGGSGANNRIYWHRTVQLALILRDIGSGNVSRSSKRRARFPKEYAVIVA